MSWAGVRHWRAAKNRHCIRGLRVSEVALELEGESTYGAVAGALVRIAFELRFGFAVDDAWAPECETACLDRLGVFVIKCDGERETYMCRQACSCRGHGAMSPVETF